MTTRRAAFLDHFAPAELERLLWYLERVAVEEGDALISEGAMDQSIFVAVRGRFEVTVRRRVVRQLEAGHVFGEIAFFASTPRTASVIAREEGEVLRMSRARFDEMRGRDANLACALALEIGRALSELFLEAEARDSNG